MFEKVKRRISDMTVNRGVIIKPAPKTHTVPNPAKHESDMVMLYTGVFIGMAVCFIATKSIRKIPNPVFIVVK